MRRIVAVSVAISVLAAAAWADPRPQLVDGVPAVGQFDATDKKTLGFSMDDYRLQLREGEVVTVTAETSPGLNLGLTLTHASGSPSSPISVSDGAGRRVRLQFRPPVGGDYVLRVLNRKARIYGSYTLTVTRAPARTSIVDLIDKAGAPTGEATAADRTRVEALRSAILSPQWRPRKTVAMGSGGALPPGLGFACESMLTVETVPADLSFQPVPNEPETFGIVRYRGGSRLCFPQGEGIIDYADGSRWIGAIGQMKVARGYYAGMPRYLPRPDGFGEWSTPDGRTLWLRVEESAAYPWGWNVAEVHGGPTQIATTAKPPPLPGPPPPRTASTARPTTPSQPAASPEIERLRRQKADAERRAAEADAALRTAEQAEVRKVEEAKVRQAAEAAARERTRLAEVRRAAEAKAAAARPAPAPTVEVSPKPAAKPAAGGAKLEYGEWVFFQSDKALQYRVALVKQEGNLATLRYQFRIAFDDDIHCRSARCEGYLLEAYNFDPDTRETITQRFLYFPNSFKGVFDYPDAVTVRFKTYTNTRSWWDAKAKLPMWGYNGEGGQILGLIHGCADNKLVGTEETRCREFDFDRMKTVR